MASKRITIDSIEYKEAKNGNAYIFMTDTTGATWSIFEDNPDYAKFINGRGTILNVETVKKGEYENILKAEIVDFMPLPIKLTPTEQTANSQAISYAKDLCCNGVLDIKDLFDMAEKIHHFITTPVKREIPPEHLQEKS
jgi:hypothetical protein